MDTTDTTKNGSKQHVPPQAGNVSAELSTTTQRTPLGFTMGNLDELAKWASYLSRSDIIPQALVGKPENVAVILLMGFELGLSQMQALRSMHVIKGKAILSSELMLALVLKHRETCEYFVLRETTPTKATYATRRKGAPKEIEMSFTMEEAKAAQLLDRPDSNWKKYPATMLRWRCISHLCRAVYPDLVLGIVTDDEQQEIEFLERTSPLPPKGALRAPPQPVAQWVKETPQEAKERQEEAVDHDTVSGEVLQAAPVGAPVATEEVAAPAPVVQPGTHEYAEALEADIAMATKLEALTDLQRDILQAPKERQEALAKALSAKRRELNAAKR